MQINKINAGFKTINFKTKHFGKTKQTTINNAQKPTANKNITGGKLIKIQETSQRAITASKKIIEDSEKINERANYILINAKEELIKGSNNIAEVKKLYELGKNTGFIDLKINDITVKYKENYDKSEIVISEIKNSRIIRSSIINKFTKYPKIIYKFNGNSATTYNISNYEPFIIRIDKKTSKTQNDTKGTEAEYLFDNSGYLKHYYKNRINNNGKIYGYDEGFFFNKKELYSYTKNLQENKNSGKTIEAEYIFEDEKIKKAMVKVSKNRLNQNEQYSMYQFSGANLNYEQFNKNTKEKKNNIENFEFSNGILKSYTKNNHTIYF